MHCDTSAAVEFCHNVFYVYTFLFFRDFSCCLALMILKSSAADLLYDGKRSTLFKIQKKSEADNLKHLNKTMGNNL